MMIEPGLFEIYGRSRNKKEDDRLTSMLECVSVQGRRGMMPFILNFLGESDRRDIEVDKFSGPAFEMSSQDTEVVRFSVAAIRTMTKILRDDEAESVLNFLVESVGVDDDSEHLVPSLIGFWARDRQWDALSRGILSKIACRYAGHQTAECYLRTLRTALDGRYSILADAVCWASLGLPGSLFDILTRAG